ncbi:MAG TPA: cytochrome c [Blastocatellia bacterium]|nr:cytochrome c [Blastocatellia bacterium]
MKLSVKRMKLAIVSGAMVAALAMVMSIQTNTQAAGAQDGAALFRAKCAMCHGADGSGNTPVGRNMKIRDLRSADVQGQTDAQLLEIVSKGKGKMPAYEKTLGLDKCKELVAFIRTLKV